MAFATKTSLVSNQLSKTRGRKIQNSVFITWAVVLACALCWCKPGFTQAVVSLSPSSLSFGYQTVGTTSAPLTVMFTNTGNATLNFSTETIAGDFGWGTAPPNVCGSTLASGAECGMNVVFNPAASGTLNGTLTVSDNAAGSPQVINLTGIGTTSPVVSVIPSMLSFGSQAVGTTSASLTVTFTNTGNTTLDFGTETIAGDFGWGTAPPNVCGSTLAAGAQCGMNVVFEPAVAGQLNGTLTVSDNATGSPQVINLTGIGGSTSGLLFESDFGGTVAMSTPTQIPTLANCSSDINNGWWPIGGGDDGFTWPITINSGASSGLQPISLSPYLYYNSTSKTINNCADNTPIWRSEIIQGTRHDGTTGGILHRANYQNMVWQLPYIISPASDVTDQYQKVWMKLPSNLATTLGPNSWYTFAEWKTTSTLSNGENYDYRIAIYIYTNASGVPYWYMTGSEHSAGPYYWTQQNTTTPVPLGQWFQFEWAWHRTHDTSSWTWVKINGTEVMDQVGQGTTCAGCDPINGFYNSTAPINRIMLGQIYGAQGAIDEWTDHVEIWNSVP